MVRQVTKLVLYQVWHCPADESAVKHGSYSGPILYEEWEELAKHAQEAVDMGRQVLIEAVEMTQAEYDEPGGPEFPDGVNPLLADA